MTHDLLSVAAVAVAAGYLAGVVRLTRRGDRWPARRTVTAIAGLALLAGVPMGGDRLAQTLAHLLTAMVAPALVALGAPVTLALRAVRTPARRRLLAVLGSGPVRVLTSAPVVVALDAAGLGAYYLTGVYAAAERTPWLHLAVHAHMVVAGFLLAQVTVGVDPLPSRPGVVGRLAVLVVAGAAHDVVAKVLYARGWGDAAQLLYYGGEAVDVALGVLVMTWWYARGTRALARPTPGRDQGRLRDQGIQRDHAGRRSAVRCDTPL